MGAKRVLVINIGWEQSSLLRNLLERDCELFGIHYDDTWNRDIKFTDVLICDLWDVSTVLKYCQKNKFDAVISDQDDYGHFLQALICEKYNLPGPSIQQAQLSLNKFIQREACMAKGIKIPNFKLVSCLEDIYNFGLKFNYPIILKPIDNRGSIGVSKIHSPEQVPKAFMTACENSRSHLMIVEEYINGLEVTVDGFCFPSPRSLAIAQKSKLDERQVSVDIEYPANLKEDIYDKVLCLNEHIAQSLGYSFGFTHGEYIIRENGDIYLVELANRGGGCHTSQIILPEVSSLPVLGLYVDFCLGMCDSMPPGAIERNRVLLKFFNFRNGKVAKIHGINSLKRNKNILKHHFFIKNGDTIQNMTSDADRHGFIIIKGDKNIRAQAKAAMNNIYIAYEN